MAGHSGLSKNSLASTARLGGTCSCRRGANRSEHGCSNRGEDIFKPDLVLGGTLNPPAQLVPVEGGYRISGRSPFVSGCRLAEWFFASATITEGGAPRMVNGSPVMMIAFFPAAQAQIIDNWDTLGMFGLRSPLGRPRRWVCVRSDRRFRRPRQAQDARLRRHRAARASYGSVARRRSPSRTECRALVGVRGARRGLADSPRGKVEVKIQLAACHATQAAARAVDLVFAVAGTTAIRNHAPFQKYFREVHTITQHAFLSASRFESVGQLMLDVNTDWPFFGHDSHSPSGASLR